MHDILEGALPLTVMMLLKYCIGRKRFFKIDTFNSCLTSFCYGQIEVTNKPTPFKQTGFSTASETTIKQSGKEFVRRVISACYKHTEIHNKTFKYSTVKFKVVIWDYNNYKAFMQLPKHGA